MFFSSKRKLVPWLRLILRNQTVLETMYQPWSYAVTTGNIKQGHNVLQLRFSIWFSSYFTIVLLVVYEKNCFEIFRQIFHFFVN